MSAEVVAQVKQELLNMGENLDGPCGAFKITSTVAWRLRKQGWGLIHSTGNGCTTGPSDVPAEEYDHYRVDTVMKRSGSVIDMLGMAESNEGKVFPQVGHETYNIPQWNPTGDQPSENWRAPYDPGYILDDGGTNPDPGDPDDISAAVQEILTAIVDSEERVNVHTTYEVERVMTKLHELRAEVIEFANKLGRVLLLVGIRRNNQEPPPE